jgi:hypothetical protein
MENTDIIIGCVLVVFVVIVLLSMTIYAHRKIEKIAQKGYRTARQTIKELNNSRQ